MKREAHKLYKKPENLLEMLLTDEDRYVAKRLLKSYMQSIPFYICRIFPIKKKKIVFTTIEGTCGYMCNPKYIAEEFIRQGLDREYELVWLVDDVTKKFPKQIRVVRNTLFNRAYELSTAGWWIDNSRKQLEVRKREGQRYIQTWHAKLGFKPTCLDRGGSFTKIAYIISKHDSDMVDYWLSNSSWYDKTLLRGSLYRGKALRTGSPRCDVLVKAKEDEDFHRRTREDLVRRFLAGRQHVDASRASHGKEIAPGGLAQEEQNMGTAERDHTEIVQPSRATEYINNIRFIMYAPTFRGGSQDTERGISVETGGLDYDELVHSLEEKFGGIWYILLRLHPQLSARHMTNEERNNRVVDVSQVDDMYELLAGCDAFITDYSSAAFDAAEMQIPVFLYCDDYDEYEEERGKLLWDLKKLPFPLAKTNAQLQKNISEFDDCNYGKTMDKMMDDTGIVEDGCASKRVVNFIEDYSNNLWNFDKY